MEVGYSDVSKDTLLQFACARSSEAIDVLDEVITFTETAARIKHRLTGSQFDCDKFFDAAIHHLLIVRKALKHASLLDNADAPPPEYLKVSGEMINLAPFAERRRIFRQNLDQTDEDATFYFLMDLLRECLTGSG